MPVGPRKVQKRKKIEILHNMPSGEAALLHFLRKN